MDFVRIVFSSRRSKSVTGVWPFRFHRSILPVLSRALVRLFARENIAKFARAAYAAEKFCHDFISNFAIKIRFVKSKKNIFEQ